MKRERLTPRDIAILGSVIVLAICCVCVGTILTTVEDIGNIITAPFRWFGNLFGSVDPGLREALESQTASSFELGENCTFPHTEGNLLRSGGLSDDDNQIVTDLTSEQVIGNFQTFFEDEHFLVEDGQIRLSSGTPVNVSTLTRESFYVSLIEEQRSETSIVTISLEGVVDENMLSGSYYKSQTTSTVIEGQGIEEAFMVMADFNCPIYWLDE